MPPRTVPSTIGSYIAGAIDWLFSDRVFEALGVGGLDTADYLDELERAFGIEIHDEESLGIETVGQLYDYVVQQLGTSSRFSGNVWQTILAITSQYFGVNIDDLDSDTRFVADLGC